MFGKIMAHSHSPCGEGKRRGAKEGSTCMQAHGLLLQAVTKRFNSSPYKLTGIINLSWGLFQVGVKQEKISLTLNFKPKFKQEESMTFMPPNEEVKINNVKPFPVNWT